MTTSSTTWNEAESWQYGGEQATGIKRVGVNIWRFVKRKPLGAVCGIIIILFVLLGDLVPETTNKILSIAGFGTPVPYLADTLAEHTPFVYPYGEQNLSNRLDGISFHHWLGTDQVGRDIFSRLLYGARVAVMVSFGAVFISESIAVTIGLVSGYYGGALDKTAYRIVDIFQALPGLVVLITILGLIGSGLWEMVLVIGLLGGPAGSRIFRGQTISIMSSPFIEAARVVGASDKRIILKYLLPNVMPLIILTATVRMGGVVLIVASLSFLGYGLPPPFPDWGGMLSLEGRQYMRRQPGLAIYPGIAIGMLVFSFNLFGDAIRDVLDPRLRGGR